MITHMLDTNIVIYVIKRRPREVLAVFNQHAGKMAISAVTYGELVHGVEKSARQVENLRVVEDFVSRLDVLPYTDKAAAHYGNIRADLERKGTPIGVNDLHIAGHARSEGLVLVSNNLREFARIDGLRLENWLSSPIIPPSRPSSSK
ncbi:tRNA(fMet)-specific endonuclease VapC [Serratia rubidaea]|uniref:Ribonuclease VapC n=1 Tax=Serratia rubidaea TaxID=61652 RepID=A0A447QD36_SERRU|nr:MULTISPECIES: type II toxin-antitoxin system VapC family toxin [Serratia]AGB83003.1 putative nucleic acid-binding protein, contains PIN domain [Serratia sp. FGI94]AML58000.1 VapC toxin protein [Serratia rubidaea]QPR63274.1 type II toxin-antitoxin system VapC family toxin [Serratia rubidaea]CAI0747278.1 tRNA(fMet)-specific endonuclease VapC [Serratia rubidaea]CAI1554487.1 tRNA(fMet)-specific endonuclease VapC [Serratia rubidaea]